MVFPEPVSPATITTWWSRIAAAMSSRRWETGSSGGKWSCTGQECVRSQIVGGIAPSRASAPSDGAVATSVTT